MCVQVCVQWKIFVLFSACMHCLLLAAMSGTEGFNAVVLEGQLQNQLTFSGQIGVNLDKQLTFLIGWCCVIFKLSDIEIKHTKVFRATYSILSVLLLNIPFLVSENTR